MSPLPTAESLLINPEARLILQGKGEVSQAVGRSALELSGIERPRVLIVPSAADSEKWYKKYVASVQDSFGDQLGAKVVNLHGFDERPTKTQIEHEFGAADVIWMTGGHTQRAAKLFEETGIDDELRNAASRAVIGGGSAGTLLIADKGMSYLTADGSNSYVLVDGLGLVHATVGPHNNYVEPEDGNTLPRSHYFREFLKANPTSMRPYIGIDHEAALLLSKDGFRVAASPSEYPHTVGTDIGITTYTPTDSGLVEARFVPSQEYVPLDQLNAA